MVADWKLRLSEDMLLFPPLTFMINCSILIKPLLAVSKFLINSDAGGRALRLDFRMRSVSGVHDLSCTFFKVT